MIVVVADDISGAAELAGTALHHGLSAEVQTTFEAEGPVDVVCVDTESRSLSPTNAAAVVAEVAQKIATATPAWIYKKCDSVLRGPVRAETEAMMDVFNKTKALLVPANPSRGRVIRNGYYLVDGTPLHETVFSRDPEHPRTTSRVDELLGGNVESIFVPDTESAADVAAHAAAVGKDTLPVGGADFFAALLEKHRQTAARGADSIRIQTAGGTTLLVCGSAASWPDRRDEAEECGIPVFEMRHDIRAVCAALRGAGQALIGIGEGPATAGPTPAELVRALADVVAQVARKVDIDNLLLEGGSTAAAIVRALGWSRLRACATSAPGVGVLTPLGATQTQLFIKPGSYPWPSKIWPRL